jgi:Bacterial regulatory proteins, luxR family
MGRKIGTVARSGAPAWSGQLEQVTCQRAHSGSLGGGQRFVVPGLSPEVACAPGERDGLGQASLRELSAELFVTPNTLKTHLRAIYRKLGAESRGRMLIRARERGLL